MMKYVVLYAGIFVNVHHGLPWYHTPVAFVKNDLQQKCSIFESIILNYPVTHSNGHIALNKNLGDKIIIAAANINVYISVGLYA
jgi:hypothetical protein